LGGYLCQLYAQYRGKRVESLILINTYVDTSHFKSNRPFFGLFHFFLKKNKKFELFQNYNNNNNFISIVLE